MKIKLFAMLFIAATTLSCSEGEESELKFTFTNSRAILIDGPTSSCTQISQTGSGGTPTKDITARYFSIVGPKLSWEGKGTALIFSIKVTMKSGGLQTGSYTCTIAGDELGWVFATGGLGWDGQLAEGAGQLVVNSECISIKCGGVDIAAGTAFTSNAQIQIDGVQVGSDGDESPIRTISTINVEGTP